MARGGGGSSTTGFAGAMIVKYEHRRDASGGIPLVRLTCAKLHDAVKPVLRSLGVHGAFISNECNGEIVLFANQVHRLGRTPDKVALREYLAGLA